MIKLKAKSKIAITPDLMSYFKKETISETRARYDQLGNPNAIYSDLLNKAMLNPKKFKEAIIQQIDKIKGMLETEIEIWATSEQGHALIKAQIKTIGKKTIEEIRQAMNEYGIKPEEILGSHQLQAFAQAIEAQQWTGEKGEHRIKNITLKIKLIKGKK